MEKHILVTNNNTQFEDYQQYTWDGFIAAATSSTTFNIKPNQLIYIDILCVPDQQVADQLQQDLPRVTWIAFDKANIPQWFVYPLTELPANLNKSTLSDDNVQELAKSLAMMDDYDEDSETGETYGRIITFGSAKGGAGKTFTSLITANYYAIDNPDQKVCLLDLDVEEPQIAIAIRAQRSAPTIKKFYAEYSVGKTDFDTMKKCKYRAHKFAKNLDFYLTPRDASPIVDADFWEQVMINLFLNYDMVFLDTGTTYMQTIPIIKAYQVADKICLVTAASLSSSTTVAEQVRRLTGDKPNNVYTKDMGLESKIHLIVTNDYQDNITNSIVDKMGEEAPIIARFGYLHPKINRMQILGEWDLFDKNAEFRQGIRDIYS